MALDHQKYADEEMALYDQLRRTKDQDELLVILSDLQSHFLEGLQKQHELKKQEWKDSQSKIKPRSLYQLPRHKAKSGSDLATQSNSKDNNALKSKTLSNLDSVQGSTAMALKSARQMPVSKFNAAMAAQMPMTHKYKFSGTGDTSSPDTDTSPMPLMTPRTKTGQYRMSLFCDIKFVKSIFVRWISCDNEVLCHVAARTLAILFSHEYLTLDQMSDLAELLLGVHETETPFATVPVQVRASRPGALLYGNISDDSDSDSVVSSSDEFGSPSPPIVGEKKKNKKKSKNNNGTSNNGNKNENENENENEKDRNMDLQNRSPTEDSEQSTSIEHANFKSKLRESAIITNTHELNGDLAMKNGDKSEDIENGPISESDDSDEDRTIERVPFAIHWNNRLYSAMRVLSTIVGNDEVQEECVLALDEWFSTEDVVIALFERSSKAGFGVLEAFLQLIKEILIRFCMNPTMGQSKLADVICRNKGGLSHGSHNNKRQASARSNRGRKTPNASHNDPIVNDSESTNVLLEIIVRRTSTLVTRATALELCPLLMISASDPEPFALQCLNIVLDDGRFNPFEPGDIHMSRTFKRGEHGKMRTVNPENPLERGYTVADYIPSLLFQSHNDVFIDQETVMRLTFLTVIKCMNTLAAKIDQAEIEAEQKMLRARSQRSNSTSASPDGTPTPKEVGSTKSRHGTIDDMDITSPSPHTPKVNFDDPDDQVEHLEGEFDLKTARKIRNFFSRDADYTRERILELVQDEDDVLIDVLLELLLIETRLRKSKSRLAKRVRYLFDPFMLFHDFLELTQADHTLLLDFLISNETAFLDYLLRFAKRMSNNWHITPATQEQVEMVMSILIRLRMTVANLHQKKLFPYSPKPLIKAMEKMEFCYEAEDAGTLTIVETTAWSTVIEKMGANSEHPELSIQTSVNKTKSSKKKKGKKAKTKLKKQLSTTHSNSKNTVGLTVTSANINDDDSKDSDKQDKRPKKLVINSLFLQDVKHARQEKAKEEEIAHKREEIQKRKAKKKKKNKTSHSRHKSKTRHEKNNSSITGETGENLTSDIGIENDTNNDAAAKQAPKRLKIKTKKNKIKGNFDHLNINFGKGIETSNNNNNSKDVDTNAT